MFRTGACVVLDEAFPSGCENGQHTALKANNVILDCFTWVNFGRHKSTLIVCMMNAIHLFTEIVFFQS